MREVTWYRVSLALPLALPALAWELWRPLDDWLRAHPGPGKPLFLVFFILTGSAGFGGVPYAVLAAALLVGLRRRSAEAWRSALLWAPVAFVPLLVAYLEFGFPVLAKIPPQERYTSVGADVFLSLIAVVLGCCYVAIALAVGDRIRRRALPLAPSGARTAQAETLAP